MALFLLIAGVTAECAGEGKFTKFMTHHVFSDINRYKLVAVMHGESVADEIGEIIDARLHVLMTDFLPDSSIAATFFSSFTLMKGPFFNERLIVDVLI